MTRRGRAALVLILLSIPVLVWLWSAARSPAPPTGGAVPPETLELVEETVVSPLSGGVLVRRAAGGPWAPAAPAQPLAAGDAVRTLPHGYAVITFFEGSTATLDP